MSNLLFETELAEKWNHLANTDRVRIRLIQIGGVRQGYAAQLKGNLRIFQISCLLRPCVDRFSLLFRRVNLRIVFESLIDNLREA